MWLNFDSIDIKIDLDNATVYYVYISTKEGLSAGLILRMTKSKAYNFYRLVDGKAKQLKNTY